MRRGQTGFTLIEMVTVITLTGVVALLLSRSISRPIEGFVDLTTRAALVDAADLALQRMSREVRLALPNSVRLTDGSSQYLAGCSATGATVCAVELLRTLEGGRYREQLDGSDNDFCAGPDDDALDLAATSDCFEVMGSLNNLPVAAGGATQTDCLAGSVDCLVVFNTGQAGANAWNGDNIAGIRTASANAVSFDISGGAATAFPLPSPQQRFHIVDLPVSFVCNPAAGTLRRFAGYAIAVAQSVAPAGGSTLLADNVESCNFSYVQGAGSRNALLTVTIVLRDTDTQGDANRVRLVQQISVPNIP